ncbi:hypothetical protein KY345_02800 [Candidatus Woesearchaeota archaeon]|nr:hypothetical protein [Candidatus Woesearchaeota archaeon]
MVFNLFRKKKKAIGPEIDIPPAPPSMPEESVELPTFPTPEEARPAPKMPASSAVEEMEKKAIKGVEEELGEREELELTKPIFIEAKLFKGVMDDIGVLRNVLKDGADRMQQISDLRDDREKNYGIWHKQIEDIQRKLIYADNVLFSKKR